MANEDSSETDAWDDIATAISAEPLPVVEGSRERPCLVVLAGQRMGQMVSISRALTIGRGADADFHIPDDGVSRIHLRLERTPQGIFIIDEDSRNGTFVNGARVQRALLHDGDKIYIGTSAILRFSYADYLEEKFQQRMYEAALRDPLTKLFNRRHLLAQLDSEFRFVVRHGSPLTVIMIDLDHFKATNDLHGHLVGDQVLSGFGALLREKLRGIDIAGRYGGEEFLIVARGIDQQAGAQVATRLLDQTRQAKLVAEVSELHVTFSAGVAAVPDERIESVPALIRAADEALYRAKRGGRDRVEIY